MQNMKFYFCDECKHIYFALPPKNICKICGNEIEQKDIVSEEDLLSCETCHAVYANFNWDKIIPPSELAEEHLCTCEHRCPTQSVLQIKKDKGYTGNIVLAGYCQCNNCRAIFIRGMEDHQKNCSVCGSKFVNPISFDPKKEKPVYACANPSHTIRLKIKDLLINVNMQVNDALVPILQREEQLRVEYQKHRQNIDQQKHFWTAKNQLENQLANLDKWALTQRLQIYAPLKSPPMRCTAYKVETTPTNTTYQKIEGCGAVADIKLKKVVDSDVQQTQIKRKPETKSTVSPEIPKLESEKVESESVPTMNRVETPPVTIPSGKEKLTNEPRTSIIRAPEEFVRLEKISNSEDYFKKLPLPKSNQIFLTIQLKGLKTNKLGKESESIIVNCGVLPIELNPNAETIQISREKLLQSAWINTKMFETQPFIFENIASMKNYNWEFSIDLKDNQLILKESKNHLSTHSVELKTGEIILDQEKINGIPLQTIKMVSLPSYYALNKLQKGDLPKFIFEIGFILPNQLKLSAEV